MSGENDIPKKTISIKTREALRSAEIADCLKNDVELEDFLIGDAVRRHDIRADYCPDTLEIISVKRTSKKGFYELHYSYEWEAYYGCRDLRKSDTALESVVFRYEENEFIFEKDAATERSTRDEL